MSLEVANTLQIILQPRVPNPFLAAKAVAGAKKTWRRIPKKHRKPEQLSPWDEGASHRGGPWEGQEPAMLCKPLNFHKLCGRSQHLAVTQNLPVGQRPSSRTVLSCPCCVTRHRESLQVLSCAVPPEGQRTTSGPCGMPKPG